MKVEYAMTLACRVLSYAGRMHFILRMSWTDDARRGKKERVGVCLGGAVGSAVVRRPHENTVHRALGGFHATLCLGGRRVGR